MLTLETLVWRNLERSYLVRWTFPKHERQRLPNCVGGRLLDSLAAIYRHFCVVLSPIKLRDAALHWAVAMVFKQVSGRFLVEQRVRTAGLNTEDFRYSTVGMQCDPLSRRRL